MAVNPVAGFTPDPMSPSPSAGMYSFADGTELYADDPELYGQVAGPSNMAGGGQGMSGAPPVPEPPPPDPNALAAQGQQLNQNLEQALATEQKRQQNALAAQGQQLNQNLEQALATEQQRQQEEEFWRTHKRVPGRPGISQEQLQSQAESGVELPVGGTTQVQMGIPDSEENREARAEVSIDQRLAAQAASDLRKSQLENKVAYLDKDTQQIQSQVAEQENIQRKAQAEVKQRMSMLDQAEQQYREHKVDPDRYFNEKGGFAKIASVIGQALGAYGAALAGTENWAQKIVDNLIERDIAAQRLEREQLGEAADNAYTRLVMATGDEDEAADLLRATQQRLTAVEREKFATAAGIPAEDVALQQWDADHLAQRQAHEEQVAKNSQDRIVKSLQTQVAYPRAAVAGGIRQKTTEEIRKDILNESQFNTTLAENAAKRAKAGETVADLSGERGVKTDPLYVEGYGKAASKAEAATLRSEIADLNTYENNLREIRSLIQDPGSLVPGSAKANRLSVLADDVELQLARRGGGIVTDSDRESAKLIAPSGGVKNFINESIQGGSTAKIDALIDLKAGMLRERIRETVQGQHPDLPERGVAK